MHVQVDGPDDAPVVLLIHGFSSSLQWFDAVVQRLLPAYRVVRVDLLGHGRTGGRAADAPAQADAVAQVLERLDATRVTAVGHSFGADVAVELAERYERVERLVILAQAPDYADAVFPRGSLLMTRPLLGAALLRIAQPVFTGLGWVICRVRGGIEFALVRQAVADLRDLDVAMFRIVLIERRDRMAVRPLDRQVADAGKPTLVVLGEKDHFYGARSADRYRAVGARVEIIPDVGHSVQFLAPERTAELIAQFAVTAR